MNVNLEQRIGQLSVTSSISKRGAETAAGDDFLDKNLTVAMNNQYNQQTNPTVSNWIEQLEIMFIILSPLFTKLWITKLIFFR